MPPAPCSTEDLARTPCRPRAVFGADDCLTYRLRGCQLEARSERKAGLGLSLPRTDLEGFVCQVRPCTGRAVVVELQKVDGDGQRRTYCRC